MNWTSWVASLSVPNCERYLLPCQTKPRRAKPEPVVWGALRLNPLSDFSTSGCAPPLEKHSAIHYVGPDRSLIADHSITKG